MISRKWRAKYLRTWHAIDPLFALGKTTHFIVQGTCILARIQCMFNDARHVEKGVWNLNGLTLQ